MWGCLKALFWIFTVTLLVLLIVVGGGWWYLGTGNFAGLIRARIEDTLRTKLGRDVYIHDVVFVRSRPTRVIINDLRIANAPNGKAKYFATVRQVEITGGVDSFWGRRIKVGRIDIRDPRLFFEVYPNGAHNFPHWQSGKRGRFDIYHLEMGEMFVTGGGFSFDDIKHKIGAVAENLASQIKITTAQDMYEGLATSPHVHVRIQDYEPFDVDLRGGFRYTPGILLLKSVALKGNGIEAFLSGKLDPLTEGVYDLKLNSRIELARIADIFRVQKTLQGTIALDGSLRGKQGNFALTGGWVAPKLTADVYDLANVHGKMNVTGERTLLDVDTARYGGGTLSAHYNLPGYTEPYPMSIDLRFNGVSLEKLFGDWGVKDTGLRGGATGTLAYKWNKDKVLDGSGTGTAKLAKNAMAFSDAKYPIPVGGSTDFALDKGVIRFSRGELVTDASTIGFTGSMRIEDLSSDLALKIHSSDFSELDRAAYNFAHSAGKTDFKLLGFGGAGDITGTVVGRLKTPRVVAHIASTGTKYNNILLGDADIDLRYDGVKSVLQFDKAVFRDGAARLSMTGTIEFPDRGPSPRFDLAVDAVDYPVERALEIVDLETLKLKGLGTGRMLVTGTPESGRVTFANMTVRQGTAYVKLNGTTNWSPGKGNVAFNLDIAANDFPVEDIAAFLDVASLPVKGKVTGTLHLEGTKSSLEGAGAVTVRNGSIMGEPVTEARADITFTKGTLKATNVTVTAPAGTLTGEAEVDLNTQRFSYNIASSSIDLSKIGLLATLQNLFGGKLVFTSSGGGTFDQPELVIEAKLNEATLQGLNLPPNAAPPSIYLAIRNGQLIIRGSVADVVTIEGNGTVGPQMTVDGTVRVMITDIAKALALSPSTASLPASGNAIIDLKLSGRLSPIEALVIDGSVPTLNLHVSEHQFTAPRPLRFGLRNGRVTFDEFTLAREDSSFTVSGYADLTGDKKLDIGLRGNIEAALLQLFMKDLRADGHINVTAGVAGTLSNPRITGTAELQDAQFKFAGFPQLIDHLTGTLVFKGDRVEIDSLRATLGGGQVVAGGFITVNGLMPERVRISLQGTDVALRYYEGLTVEGTFNILVNGDLERAAVTGDVNVTRALYFKDFDFQASLVNVLLSRRGVQPVVSASWQDRVDLRLHVMAPGTLAVRNNIADVTGSAELDVTGTLSNPVVLGLITLEEGGRVRIQNVDYHVVRGSINFQNPFRIDPYFDVTIEGRVSSTGAGGLGAEVESGPVDVTINLTGTIDRFTPSITSDPPASDITLFSLLGFGGLVQGSERYGQPAPNAALAGRSLLYQSLFSALGQKILPFADSFTYDPGLLDTTGDQRPKVTFEKRLSSALALLVVYSISDGKTRQVLEWAISPEWTLQATRDEIRTKEFRMEARFRRRYSGQWTFGGRGKNPLALFAGLRPMEDVEQAPPPAPPPPTPPSTQVPADGVLITGINYVTDARFATDTLGQYVALKVGQPLSIRAEQSTIKALFATGDFRDIRIDATPDGAGVAITIRLFLNYRIGRIIFTGLHGSDRSRAERELDIHAGEVLSLNAVERSAAAVQQSLVRNGYLQAAVDYETRFVRPRSLADVEFFVNTGPLAHIGTVLFEGDTKPFTPQELTKQLRRGPGKPFVLADARNDADRIRNFLVRRNYRKADVAYLGYTYDNAAKTVTLRYRVNVGPIVKVEVEGVSRGAVRRVLPFARNQAYSEDVIDRAADDILTLYQQRGYYNVAVDTEGRLVDPNTWVTTFHVSPGQRYRLAAVTFTGNARISDKELAKIVQTAPKGGIRTLAATIFRQPTGVTRAQLGADRDAIESYYRLHGFPDAKVATPVVNTKPDGTMTVDFPIDEGVQTILTAVTIEGNEQVKTEDLPKPQLQAGMPLNPQLEREDIVALQTFYADRGNAEVQVAPRAEVSADKTTAKLAYVIAEGPKIEVDEVVVRGNTYTDSVLILRKSELRKGEPFSYTNILEAQRNLYRLGIFRRVDIQPEQAGTSVGDRNVVISIEEGKNLTVAGSIGLTKQPSLPISPLGSISIAHRNLFGTGRYLGLELVKSLERNEAFLTYREPFIFNYDLPLQLTVFRSDSHRTGAHIVQSGTFAEVTKIARLQTRWSLRYEYRIGECVKNPDEKNDLCALAETAIIPGVDPSVTNISISSITPTFFWDRRDDPLNPHRGFFTSASIEYAFELFRANARFLKTFTQGSYYLPLGRSTLALSGRIGMTHPIAGTEVPLSERFTAGGENSHRAFPLDRLGTICETNEDGTAVDPQCVGTLILLPDGTVAPVGGNGLLVMNAEYRFPIFSSVGGAVFVDAGQVYRDSQIKFGDIRYGIGTGLRYLSPVGPLRFDIGYNPDKRKHEHRFSYFITLGYAF